jgi:hypothetical protein
MQQRNFTSIHKFVVLSLRTNPNAKGTVVHVSSRNVAVALFRFMLLEFLVVLMPVIADRPNKT